MSIDLELLTQTVVPQNLSSTVSHSSTWIEIIKEDSLTFDKRWLPLQCVDANRTSDDRRLLLLLLDCNQEDPPHFLSKERITEAYLRVVGYLYIQGRVLFLLL